MSYMTLQGYDDQELGSETQQFYLRIASFVIRVKFLPTEHVWFKRTTISNFLSLWKNMLVDKAPTNFTLELEYGPKDYPGLIWNYDKKVVSMKGLQGMWAFQAALRHLLMYLVKGAGFVFHGSAVADKQSRLHIFSARSGGGKSTTARWMSMQGWKILTDDLVVFMKQKGKWVCYSSGFVEKQFLPTYFKIDNYRIYFVNKALAVKKTRPKTSAEKLQLILKQVWMLDGLIDEQTYKMVAAFTGGVEVFNLELPLKPKKLLEVLNEN